MGDRDQPMPTVLAQAIGGVRGAVDSGLPAVVFVMVAALASLPVAVVAAFAVVVALLGIRLARREPLRYAASGCFGVVVSALVALWLGSAKAFFLPGIAVSAIYGMVFLGSVVVRRPLVGLLVRALGRPAPTGWRADATTLLWAAIFLSRAVVQGTLFTAGATGWLAGTKLAMGWPLTILGLAVTAAAVRRAAPAVEPPVAHPAEERVPAG